jgi:PAS domain S-box-containing protein
MYAIFYGMPVFDQDIVNRLKQILKWHPRGITISELAAKMEMNRNLIAKYLDILLISGQVEMQVIGAAKVYFLSHRVPISSILEFSSDMVIVLDSARTIIQVNEPLLAQLHEKKEALAGRNIKEIDHPFISAIPVLPPSKSTDPVRDQVREYECTLEGMKHYYKIKQLQTAFEDGSEGITLIIEDITSQKTYQKMLELSEAKYRGIIEDQTDFITRFQPDGTLGFVNDAYTRYLGKKKEELLGQLHIPDIEDQDVPTVQKCIQSLDMNNPVQSFECRIHHSCGRQRWNLWTVRALFDDHQKIIEYQGVGRDNTEKREAATRINQYIRDMEFLSRKAQEFVELPPEADIFKIIGQGISELLPSALLCVNSYDPVSEIVTARAVFSEQDHQILSACLGREYLGFQFALRTVPEPLKTHALSTLMEGKLIDTDTSLYDFFFQQVPIETCNLIQEKFNLGDRYYCIGLVRHNILFGVVSFSLRKGEKVFNSSLIETYIRQASVVLHRRVTEDALRKSEKLYRSVIENIQDVFYRSDKEGNLVMASGGWAKMFGYESLDECLGLNIAEKFYFEPQQREKVLEAIYRDGAVNDYEIILKSRDGSPVFVSTNSHLYHDDAGEVLGVEGVLRDISERRAANERIRYNLSQLEFFSRKIQELIEFPPHSDIYYAIGQGLKELLPDSMIIVNDYDRTTGMLTIRALIGDKAQATALKYLQSDLTGLSLQVNEPIPENILAGKIYPVQKNLYSVLSQNFSQDVSSAIMQELNLGDLYYLSLVWRGAFLGNITFGLPKGENLEKIPFIETYGKAASIVLQRKIAEESLKQSQEIFSSVAKYAPVPLAIIEPDGRYQFVNQKFIEIFGYDLNDFKTGKEWFSLVYPDPVYRNKVIDAWKSDLETAGYDQPRPRTYTVRCKNGVEREILFRPVTLSNNTQCVVYEDVTEQHRDDRAQNFLTSIIENSPDAIISNTIDGTITSWNQAAERLYGYRNDEILGRNITAIIPAERYGEMEEIFTRIRKGESTLNLETLRVRKDGKIISVAVTVSPIMDKTGTITGASAIARCIPYNSYEPGLPGTRGQYDAAGEQLPPGDPESRKPGTGRTPGEISPTVEYRELVKPATNASQSAVINAFTLPDTGNKNSPDHETIPTPGIVNDLNLTNALKMARDYIAILDLSGKCLWANETMTNVMDLGDHGDLSGRNFALCIAPEYRKTALASLVEAKKTGYKTVPLMLFSSSGRIPVEVTLSTILAADGDISGFLAIARNAEREKVEKHA